MSDTWNKFLVGIREKTNEINYIRWFKNTCLVSEDGDKFVIGVPNSFTEDWLREYYMENLMDEATRATGHPVTISFEVKPELEPAVEADVPEPVSLDMARPVSTEKPHLNARYSFENFVVGAANQFAHAAARAVGDLPGGHYNPLFVYGGVGLGKSHLLHAIGLALLKKFPALRIICITGEQFMNELINCIRFDKMDLFRKKYRESCDVLLMDDVQFIAGKERTQEEFFHTFNTLYESQKQIVLTSDRFPKDISGLEKRLCSRFEWGLIADIQAPDLETRIAIIRKKADTNKIAIPDDVALYLAERIKTNVREMEGSLIRLSAHASLDGAPITVALAESVMGNLLSVRGPALTIEDIQKVVANKFQVKVSDLKSASRTRQFATPRQIAMFLSKKLVGASFPEIGSRFGGKDHSTVIHAFRKIERLLKEDEETKSHIASIERLLKG